MFRLGYNTNGLAHNRLLDSLRLMAELGYEGVAITPDVGQLDPFHIDPLEVADTRRWASDLGLSLVLETGARYLLDGRRKHHPTLLEDDPQARKRRVGFYRRTIDLAVAVGASTVSIWSGEAPKGSRRKLFDRLAEGLEEVLEHARGAEIQIGFEPEPGMLVERPADYLDLVEHMGPAADTLGLTLDVGHLVVTGDLPAGDQIRTLAPRLMHVHLDDALPGVHEHRMFGVGELDVADVLDALIEVGYDGLAAVELSRDSHRGPWAAGESMTLLREVLAGLDSHPRGC